MATTNRVKVGSVAQLPPGIKKLVKTPLENILLVNVEGQYFAVSNTCPHAGGYLNFGPLTDYIIECPLHFWPFDVRSGALVGMEDTGIEEDRLNIYPTSVEDGEVFIELPPLMAQTRS